MTMTTAAHSAPASEMNVTPLIDVLLVLLIIFMIIAPSQGLKTLVPQPPADDHPQKNDDKAVVLQVLEGGTLKLNSEPITWDTMQMRLSEVFALRFDKVLFVKGDANVDFEQVARAIDLAKSAGVDRVGLLTAKIEGGN